jgi:hypothetical protein
VHGLPLGLLLIFISNRENGANCKYHTKKTEALLDARKKVGLEVNAKKAKYIHILSPDCRTKS